jgi:hypothetical protein
MYFIHRHNAGKHKALFENIQLSLAPDGFGMVMQF